MLTKFLVFATEDLKLLNFLALPLRAEDGIWGFGVLGRQGLVLDGNSRVSG